MRCVKLINNVIVQFNNLMKNGQLYYAVSLYFFKIRCQIKIITVILLGLIICKTIIEIHGGRIPEKSKPGESAEFFINLPYTVGKNN